MSIVIPKRVLVVGGAGYVGGAVTDALASTPHEVRVYDALWFEHAYLKPVSFVRGDVRDTECLLPHLAWADVVIWLAAVVADASCDLYPQEARAINTDAVLWLTEHFQGRIVFPSTCLVYDITGDLLTEESRQVPRSLYAQTKQEAERLLAAHRNAIVFRLSTLFGLGDHFSRPRMDLVTNLLTARAVTEGRLTVHGGTQSRPFLHVRDVAQAMARAVDQTATGVYNLHAVNRTILELAEDINRMIPTARIETTPADTAQTGDYRISSDRARHELGFHPTHTLADGISEWQSMMAEGRLSDGNDPRYNNAAHIKAHGAEFIPWRVSSTISTPPRFTHV